MKPSMKTIMKAYSKRLQNAQWVASKTRQFENGLCAKDDPAPVALGLIDYRDFNKAGANSPSCPKED